MTDDKHDIDLLVMAILDIVTAREFGRGLHDAIDKAYTLVSEMRGEQ